MKKNILIVLTIVSILIIELGFLIAKNIRSEIIDQTDKSDKAYFDGTDVTTFEEFFTEIGSGVLGFIIIIYAFLLVGAIWGIYGIILLIMLIAKNIKKSKVKE